MLEDVGELASIRQVDVVIFTGDLSMSGEPSQFSEAKETLLDPLRELLSISFERFILVPGNHDIDRDAISAFLEPGLQQALTSTPDVDRLLASEAEFQQATTRCLPWRDFHSAFYQSAELTRPNELSVVHHLTIDGATIGVAAFDSSWRATGRGDDLDKYQLIIGETQAREALDLIDDCDLRLVCFHHPLEWLAQWNHPLIRDELERRGTIVFSGHEHVTDPALTHTIRGSAFYCKEGCLYQGRGYPNGYSVIDIEPRDQTIAVNLRGWIPARQVFRADTNRAENGLFETRLPRPRGQSMVQMPKYTVVTSTLATMAQSRSLFSAQLRTDEPVSVDEVLVEPRLFPAPYTQIAAAVSFAKSRSRRIDSLKIINPLLSLRESRVLIVSGDRESGVTDCLYWLLAQQFANDGVRIPAYVPFEIRSGRHPYEKPIRDAARGFGIAVGPSDPMPPLIVALDDVHVRNGHELSRLAEHIASHERDLFIIGCHGDNFHAIVHALKEAGLDPSVAHLGPFGREQTARLLELTGVADLTNSVDRVLSAVFDENLPRTPFVLAALAAVLASSPENEPPNVSTLLDAVVNYLLGKGNVGDIEAELDSRRREHLLETMAGHLTLTESWRMQRADAEEFFDAYFKSRGIERSVSPGNVLNSIIKRKILVEDHEGVGFSHGSIQHVFAAKFMLEDAGFAIRIKEAPLKFSEIVRHASALRRTDRELLELVGNETRRAMEDAIARSNSSFDLLQSKDISPMDDSELDQRIDDVRPKSREETNRELSEYYENREISEHTSPEWILPAETAEALHATLFLSFVLSGSELVDDVELKTEFAKRAIMAWGALAEDLGTRTEDWEALRNFFEELFPEGTEQRRDAMWAVFVRISAMISTAVTMTNVLGTSGLGAAIRSVADDESIASSPTYSLFVTMLFSELNLNGYVKQLERTFTRHRKHVVVSDVTRMMALARFMSPSTPDHEANELVTFLADAMAASPPARDSVRARARRRSSFIQKLKTKRAQHSRDSVGSNLIEDILEIQTDSDILDGEAEI